MDIFMMQCSSQSKFLVIIDRSVYVYKDETSKFDRPFLSFKPNILLLVNRKFVL